MIDCPAVEPERGMRSRLAGQLVALCTSVAFERAAFYGLQSILALYLADVLVTEGSDANIWLLPELSRLTEAEGLSLAGLITGIFVSTAALAPAIGGIIADRLIGPHRTILTGGAMMSAGHGLLIFDQALLPALGVIALGSGLFKGPVAARLSGLFTADDPQRVEGFRLFYLAINIAGLAAPLLIGTVGERVNWHGAFALSCSLMVIGLAVYCHRFGMLNAERVANEQIPAPCTKMHIGSLYGLVLLGLSIAMLTVPNAQLSNAYLLWVNQGLERNLWGWEFPASWMIAADGLLSLLALIATGLFWRISEQRSGAVTAETKAMIGASFVTCATALLVGASTLYGERKVPVAWGLGFQLFNSLGLANVLPAAMAIFGQSSTIRYATTAMAGFYLSLFAGGLASTWLAGQFTSLPNSTFWLLHALCAVGGTMGLAVWRYCGITPGNPRALAGSANV